MWLCVVFGTLTWVTVEAGTPENDTSLRVYIPHIKSGFAIEGSALLWQPTTSAPGYAILTNPLPLESPKWQVQQVPSRYRFGFELGGRYAFEQPGVDVRAMWFYLDTKDKSSISAEGSQFVGPFYEIGPNAGTLRSTGGKVDRNYNFVVLEAGQLVQVGERFRLRAFGGLDYLAVKQNIGVTFSGGGAFETVTHSVSNFNGVGPRLGLTGDFGLSPSWFVSGTFAGSISVGQMKTWMSFVSSSEALKVLGVTANFQDIKAQNTTQVVPGVETKLALVYRSHLMKPSDLVFEVGYAAAAFIDAVIYVQPNSSVTSIQTGTTAVATMNMYSSNLGINGPYVSVALHPSTSKD